MKHRIRAIVRSLPAVVWMAVIYWLSDQTGNELGSRFEWLYTLFPWFPSFNFGHVVAYFILALLLWFAIGSHRTGMKWLVIGLCLLYGISDEFHQRFVPGRTPDIRDLLNDTIGAILAMLLISIPVVKRLLTRRFMPISSNADKED